MMQLSVYLDRTIRTGAGTSRDLIDHIRGLDQVRRAHIVAGEFDIIAEVSADEVYDVLHTSSSSIQGLEGVLDTKTYIAMD